ncbi:MAG: DUF4384 domain-containing protein [Muribaculaceae bacterium]|nr:DUF4384 domain-containing protein [Muribaculaceae bacterium]
MLSKRLAASVLILSALCAAFGQRTATVTAEYDYYAPADMTPRRARAEAIEMAQLNAIAREFGSSLSKDNISILRSDGRRETDEFHMFTASDVRGEWIETLGDTTVTVEPYRNEFVYHVKLRGRIREIKGCRIDLDWAVLFNGTDPDRDRLRDFTFRVGDYMYVYFCSPVSGYLTVYLSDDDAAHTMQCLLPYRGQREGAYAIEADKPYIFFSPVDANDGDGRVARIKMNAHGELDINQLYLIFSPNEFVKVADTNSSAAGSVAYDRHGNAIELLPRQTDFARFQKWLARCRRHDPDMQVLKAVLKIER